MRRTGQLPVHSVSSRNLTHLHRYRQQLLRVLVLLLPLEQLLKLLLQPSHILLQLHNPRHQQLRLQLLIQSLSSSLPPHSQRLVDPALSSPQLVGMERRKVESTELPAIRVQLELLLLLEHLARLLVQDLREFGC